MSKDIVSELMRLSGLEYTPSPKIKEKKRTIRQINESTELAKQPADPILAKVIQNAIAKLTTQTNTVNGRMKYICERTLSKYEDILEAAANDWSSHAKKFYNELDEDAKSILMDSCESDEQRTVIADYFTLEEAKKEKEDKDEEKEKSDDEKESDEDKDEKESDETEDKDEDKDEDSEEDDESKDKSDSDEDKEKDEDKDESKKDMKENFEVLSYDEATPHKMEDEVKKVKVPKECIRDLKAVIADCRARHEEYKNDSQHTTKAHFQETAADALQYLLDCLSSGSPEHIKQATLHMTSIMGPIANKIPSCVRLFLVSGAPNKSLKDYFKDSRDS